jgi:hypothetical protein
MEVELVKLNEEVVQNISHKMKHASRYEKNLVSDLEGWIVK